MTDESQGQASLGSMRAPMDASLDDETIRRVRIVVELMAGLTATVVGIAALSATNDQTGTWERADGFAWLLTAVGCFATIISTWISLLAASEALMLLTAYVGTGAVLVCGPPESAFIVGASAYSLVVLLPGVTFRIRTPRTSLINTIAVCMMYSTCIILRVILREDSGVEDIDDVARKVVVPVMAFFVTWSLVRALNRRVLLSLSESERARRALRNTLDRQVALNEALAKFVPREFLTTLGRDDISEVKLSDSVTKTMSILFADICGYTRLVEGMPPAETVQLLNNLFGALEPAITKHGGFVDSYIGDAIMALFEGSPRNALDAALAMLAALKQHNDMRRAAGDAPIAIGIGIHTGVVTLGTTGGPKRFKCSVFGDAVNLAARIEHLTRRYESTLLASAQTLELAGDHGYTARIVDRVRVVGRTGTTELYEVYDADPVPLRERKRQIGADYHAGVVAFYERRFAAAAAAFERCREHHDDAVLRTYLCRSRALHEKPPDADWTGVEILHEK